MPSADRLSFSPAVARRLLGTEHAIVVTGGGGWLGQATLEMLEQALGESFAARVRVFGSARRPLRLRSGRTVQSAPLSELAQLPPQPCLVAHYAFLTRDRVAGLSLRDFVEQNEAISSLVAVEARRLGAAGVFVPSSGAVYGRGRTLETDLATNPYGAMKARDEERFLALAGDEVQRVLAIRIFNLAGPFINKIASYALSSILTDIRAGGPVVLRADRPVVRSYVHVRDVIELAFALLTRAAAAPTRPFDTAGEIEIEVGELARRAARLLGRPQIAIDRPPLVAGAADRYVGDGGTMAALLAAEGLGAITLDDQIRATARYLAEI
jgi:nucleoside-diphosphate-sugar epimerase